MSTKEEIEKLLKDNGAVLMRQKKHCVYRLTNGKMFTVPKTPSDNRGWDNCLRSLLRILGMGPTVKTHADFEHQKKEPYVKPVEPNKEFLAGLAERESRPATPPSESPLVWMKRKLQKDKEEQLLAELKKKEAEEERKVFAIGGHVPMAGPGTGHGKRWSGYHRHGTVVTYSQAKIAEMNMGLASIGEIIKAKEKEHEDKEEDTMNPSGGDIKAGSATGAPKEGALEAALRNAREEMNRHKVSEQAHHLEYLRFEQIVTSLEQTLKLATASRASLKDILPGGQNGMKREVQGEEGRKKPSGFWKEKAREVLVTAPISLNTTTFLDEMLKNHPDTNRPNLQQMMYKALKDGWLTRDAAGFLKYKDV